MIIVVDRADTRSSRESARSCVSPHKPVICTERGERIVTETEKSAAARTLHCDAGSDAARLCSDKQTEGAEGIQ